MRFISFKYAMGFTIKHETKKILLLLLTTILVICATCSTQTKVVEFVPDFSQERIMETIRFLSEEDGGRIAEGVIENWQMNYLIGSVVIRVNYT